MLSVYKKAIIWSALKLHYLAKFPLHWSQIVESMLITTVQRVWNTVNSWQVWFSILLQKVSSQNLLIRCIKCVSRNSCSYRKFYIKIKSRGTWLFPLLLQYSVVLWVSYFSFLLYWNAWFNILGIWVLT